MIFLIRNAWTGLSYLCLVGTYVGLLRQFLVYDSASNFWFEIVHGISFWPAAIYLAGAWAIYTAGVFLSTAPNFAAGKRMAFLCLNNGALIGLLTLVSYLSRFGHLGPIFCTVGGLFLATSYLARRIRTDAEEVAGAYLIQGLALATGGLVIVYSGVTRGLAHDGGIGLSSRSGWSFCPELHHADRGPRQFPARHRISSRGNHPGRRSSLDAYDRRLRRHAG